MKIISKSLLCLLLLAKASMAQTPLVGAHPASNTGSVTIAANAGDLAIVACEPNPKVASVATDSAGDTFTPFPTAPSTDTSAMLGYWTRVATTSASLKLSCGPATNSNQIYTAVLSGAGTPVAIAASGTKSPATATIASAAGDLLLTAIETGTATNTAGWTALSTLNSNLLASMTANGPAAPSFTVSAAWNMLLVDIPPAAIVPPPPPPQTASVSFSCTPSFLPATVSTFVPSGAKGLTFALLNSGTVPLIITQITPPAGFAIDAAPALPVTIAAGDSQTFTIRFVPATPGTYAGNVVFLANVPNGDFLMGVQATAN